ncbi:MAG: DUF4416 family protein [Thermodesulfobacteriota bacterium]|nr:DUF4416 family protein [Thermodesulfobacteriota bacterium]
MSIPKQPDKAKLIISLFMNNKDILNELLPMLEEQFGSIDIISSWIDFNYTDYYYKEMGSPLFRRVIVFTELVEQKSLAKIKEKTNLLEKRWKKDGNRSINIDPGYLLLSRFILATGKDFSHRIYLDRGIYADLTLVYKQGGYKTLDWTYPDYAAPEMTEFLNIIRAKYSLDLKMVKNG